MLLDYYRVLCWFVGLYIVNRFKYVTIEYRKLISLHIYLRLSNRFCISLFLESTVLNCLLSSPTAVETSLKKLKKLKKKKIYVTMHGNIRIFVIIK